MSAPPARPLPPGIRVNQIQTLPHLTDVQKAQYTRGVAGLYEAFQKHDKESNEYKSAAAKLLEFTKKMGKEMNEWKANQAAQAAGGQQPQAAQQQAAAADRPQSQGQQGQPPQQPPPQTQGQAIHATGQQPLPAQIVQHINNFPFQLPPNIPAGSPEAEAKLKEVKNHYASMLHRQEQLAQNLKKMATMMAERQNAGQDIPPNWISQKPQMEAQFAQVKRSVQDANPNGPIPLTHNQAMASAARTYSDSRGTPQIPAAQGYQPIGNRTDQIANPKMPIPKTLNAPPPHPVNMGPARPTLGGPSNGAPGMMGQPVIAGHPQYHLEGDENRVLSKKKLDELVRQVTGVGEPTGEALSPEVEEAMLQLADDFLDNVVSSACKLAKLRESSQLEIRDIQNILERNYNIRIPGYASDEVRTVRKFQPAPGWTQKMNAVQAAKVMGGKTD
ncbi:putative transcription initiation factor tfiid subunit 12 [Diplodia seriata]|uniref:Putative transcription initiation factor tfiid subunit 12 n=1 Tax=Diplodia seriata TaxID=420778 RepID=A0A0G2HCW8_9PEZI|nr:putative transcription initiation factor tfiid subunit 12 [Diplodia seriata]